VSKAQFRVTTCSAQGHARSLLRCAREQAYSPLHPHTCLGVRGQDGPLTSGAGFPRESAREAMQLWGFYAFTASIQGWARVLEADWAAFMRHPAASTWGMLPRRTAFARSALVLALLGFACTSAAAQKGKQRPACGTKAAPLLGSEV
jgi:hypothetical protein